MKINLKVIIYKVQSFLWLIKGHARTAYIGVEV